MYSGSGREAWRFAHSIERRYGRRKNRPSRLLVTGRDRPPALDSTLPGPCFGCCKSSVIRRQTAAVYNKDRRTDKT